MALSRREDNNLYNLSTRTLSTEASLAWTVSQVSGKSDFNKPVTFSIAYDSAGCGKTLGAVALSQVKSSDCWEVFAEKITNWVDGNGCHRDNESEQGRSQDSTTAPSPGGTFYDNYLVYSVAAKVRPPPDFCPKILVT